MTSMKSNQEDVADQDLEAIDSLSRRELRRIKNAQIIYAAKKPRPTTKIVSFWQGYGLEVFALLMSAIGAITVSAFRVGLILYVSELNLASLYAIIGENWILNLAPVIIGLGGLLAFDGYLFAHGYKVGKTKKEVVISNWGLLAAGIVTTMAGLLSSMTLGSENVVTRAVQWIVIVSTGVGAPVVSYFGAMNIGVTVNAFEIKKEDVKKEFEKEMDTWEAAASTYYSRQAANIYGVDRGTTRKNDEEPKEERNFAKEIRDYLEANSLTANEVGDGPGFIITPHVIAEKLGINPSTMRTNLSRIRENMKKYQGE